MKLRTSTLALVGCGVIALVFLVVRVVFDLGRDDSSVRRGVVNFARAVESPPYELQTSTLEHNGVTVYEMRGNRLSRIGDTGEFVELNGLVNRKSGAADAVGVCIDYYGSSNLDVRFADPIRFVLDDDTLEWGASIGAQSEVRFGLLTKGQRVTCTTGAWGLYRIVTSKRVRVTIAGHGSAFDREVDEDALRNLRHFVKDYVESPDEAMRLRLLALLGPR